MAGLTAAIITCAQPRLYQAQALVELRTINENFLNLRNIYPAVDSKIDPAFYLQTQAELLQQDSLIEEVARKLRLQDRPEFQPPSALLGKLRDDIRIMPLRNTRILQIVCDARNPSLAADLANTLARTFIEQNIETRQHGASQTYESLQLQLEELRQKLPRETAYERGHPGLRRTGSLRAREVGLNHIYKAMLQQAYDAHTASLVRQSNIELIAPAEPPTRTQKPNLPLNLGIGIFDGLLLAIGYAMLQENTPVVRDPGEAATLLALPELGAIPSAGAQTPLGLGSVASRNGKPHLGNAVLEHRSSWVSESFRSTLTSILSGHGDHPRIVVVTSSRPMEGKTTTVGNLGCALAELGRKTLLIDGDVRHPQLQRIFAQPNGRRSAEVADPPSAIELPADALVKETSIPHLFLLACGAQTGAVFGLSHPDRMSRLFERFREEFDYVLVDTPPCFEFPDARNLARYSDGIVLVVRAGYTGRTMVRAAVERLEDDDGVQVIGVVLNGWDPIESSWPWFSHGKSRFWRPGYDFFPSA